MDEYVMRRFTIVAPAVKNDGSISAYPAKLRDALMEAGYTGWTEYQTMGYWKGKGELGVTFELFLPAPDDAAHALGRIARTVMPDQEAIQVTYDTTTTVLLEA